MEHREKFAALVCPGGVKYERSKPLRTVLVVGESPAVRAAVQVACQEDPEPFMSLTIYSKVITRNEKPLLRVLAARDSKLSTLLAKNSGPRVFVIAVDVRTPKVLRKRLEDAFALVKKLQESLDEQEKGGGETEVDKEVDSGAKKNIDRKDQIVLAVAGTGSEVVGSWEDESGWRDREFEMLSCEIRRFALRECNRASIAYLGDGKDIERNGLINALMGTKTKARLGLTDLLVPADWDSETFIDSVLEPRGIECSRTSLVDDLPEIAGFVVDKDPWQVEDCPDEEPKCERLEESQKNAQDISDDQPFLKMLRERIAKTTRQNAMRKGAKGKQEPKAPTKASDDEDTQSFFKSLLTSGR